MTSIYKKVIETVPFEDIIAFIDEDSFTFSTIRTQIKYRTYGSFAFMYEVRKADNAIINTDIFFLPSGTIEGYFEGDNIIDEDFLKDSEVAFRSPLYSDQSIRLNIMESEVMPNVLSDKRVKLRAYAYTNSIQFTQLLNTIIDDENTKAINKTVLQKEQSVVLPLGLMISSNEHFKKNRLKKISKATFLIGKVLNYKKISFTFKNVSIDFTVFTIRSPFLGTIDVLYNGGELDLSNIQNDETCIYVATSEINATFMSFIPSESVKPQAYELLLYIANRINANESCNELKGYFEKNAELYYNGILIDNKFDTIVDFFKQYQIKNKENDKDKTADIVTLLKVNPPAFTNDKLNFYEYSDDLPNLFKRYKKRINSKDKGDSHRQSHLQKSYYDDLLSSYAIAIFNPNLRVIDELFLFKYSKNGKISSVELLRVPVYFVMHVRNQFYIHRNYYYPHNGYNVRLIKNTWFFNDLKVIESVRETPLKSDAKFSYRILDSYYIYNYSVFKLLLDHFKTNEVQGVSISTKIDCFKISDIISSYYGTSLRDDAFKMTLFSFAYPFFIDKFYEFGMYIRRRGLIYPELDAETFANILLKQLSKLKSYELFTSENESDRVKLQSELNSLINLMIIQDYTPEDSMLFILNTFFRYGTEREVKTLEVK